MTIRTGNMIVESNQQFETYRAIILGQGGTELLLILAADRLLLPSVQVPRWKRLAENLTASITRDWGLDTVCLFTPDVGGFVSQDGNHNYQVLECHGRANSHGRAAWVQLSSLSQRAFTDARDRDALERALAVVGRCPNDGAPGPFARLGWFRELQNWVEEVIEPLGFRLTGSFSQLNASPTFSLARFETSGPAIWFKAVGEPNLREFPITLTLARSFPQYLPPILCTRPAWNGWLALEVEGTSLAASHDLQDWKTAASSLAKLQIESVCDTGSLLSAGVRDLRTPVLCSHIRPFLDAMSQLMDRQTKVPPHVLSRDELLRLGEQLEEALSVGRDLGIPNGLGHLDLNPGNAIVSRDGCAFLDWAEAYVGNPLLSFQYLLEHFRRLPGMDATAEASLSGAYREEWKSLMSPESLEEAMGLAPLLAVFAYAVANNVWSDDARLQDAKVAGYFRSLTRRMQSEANRLSHRSALCRN